MSPLDARQSAKHLNNLHKIKEPVIGVIDLTSSPENSDREEHWNDARQSLSPQNSETKSRREQVAHPNDIGAGGVVGGMSVHDHQLALAVDPEIMGFEEGNGFWAQNVIPHDDGQALDIRGPRQASLQAEIIDADAELWEDYVLNNEGDLEAVSQAIIDTSATLLQPISQKQQSARNHSMHQDDSHADMAAALETKEACITTLTAIFPGICPDHVLALHKEIAQTSDQLITYILDQTDKGIQYPKAKDKQKSLKRKRMIDEDEEVAKRYGAVDRVVPNTRGGIRPFIRNILMQEFSVTPATFIDATLTQSSYRLFSAYRVLEEAHRTYDGIPPPYNKIKTARKLDPTLREAGVAFTLSKPDADQEKVEVLKELQAARKMKNKGDVLREAAARKKDEEDANVKKAELEGTMAECECCCGDYPRNRMVHCNSEDVMHWFCRDCARTSAEVEIGKSKYDLRCMSIDMCEAGFSMNQRDQFLDETTKIALERNEQEANLRLAGIENLESCPFCPFAAEYPPVEIDREFRCQAEDCEKVSCRLCKLESHIPKSCEEFAKENGLSIRRQIEEAMSAALIRKCNKCNTPFVKEEGCNKMTCTRNGCMNIQCYVCSKSCSYDHFNDVGRGGKAGNCPLFESIEQRHEDEVKKAEKETLEKILAEHPEYTAEELKVEMSENVKQDDEMRKARNPAHLLAMHGAMLAAAANGRPAGQFHPMPLALPGEDWFINRRHAGRLRPFMAPHLPAPPPAPNLAPVVPPAYVPIRERYRFGGLPRPPPEIDMWRRPLGPGVYFHEGLVDAQLPANLFAEANIPPQIRGIGGPELGEVIRQVPAPPRIAAARGGAAMARAIAAREEAMGARARFAEGHARFRDGNLFAGPPVAGVPAAPPAGPSAPPLLVGLKGRPDVMVGMAMDDDIADEAGMGEMNPDRDEWLNDFDGTMFDEEEDGDMDFW